MNRILITGTKGFIGSQLKNELERLGHQVYELNEEYFDSDSWSSELYVSLRNSDCDVVNKRGVSLPDKKFTSRLTF